MLSLDSFLVDSENVGLTSMDAQEMEQTDGGIVPLVILGVTITGKMIAGFIGGCILAAGCYSGYRAAEAANR